MSWNPIHLMNSMRTASLALMRAQGEATDHPAGLGMHDTIKAIAERVATVLGQVMLLAVESAGTAVTEPPFPRAPGPEWFEFLDVRARAIRAMLGRGYDPSDICRHLNLRDENHVHAISIAATPTVKA